MDGKELAKFIDEELDARGLKKKSFYEATGISSATLSQWRVGRYNPSDDNLVAVERFFGVQFLTFVDLDAENKKSAAPEGAALHADTQYDYLTSEQKAVINAMIAQLYKSQSDD